MHLTNSAANDDIPPHVNLFPQSNVPKNQSFVTRHYEYRNITPGDGYELTAPRMFYHHPRRPRRWNHIYHEHAVLDPIEDSQSSWHSGHLGLGSLPGLVFIGFLIYAISVSHTDAVANACGAKLWEYMLARLILSFVGIFVICCTIACMSVCFHSSIAAGVITLVVLLTYYSTMLGIGTPIVMGALASSQCVTALSATSFTNTPMLAILGAVIIGLDALMLFVVVCGVCVGIGFVATSTDD
jgi:hypothetical protein